MAYDSAKKQKSKAGVKSKKAEGLELLANLNDTNKNIEEPKYTDTERADRLLKLQLMERARNQREAPNDLWNGMGYTQHYTTNLKAANSFTPPRKNADDSQVVTGTTREKILAIVAAVLNLNFESRIRAFDKDDMEAADLGEAMTDCVDKSKKMELWENKKIDAYMELAIQGDCFVQDTYVEETRVDKKKIRVEDLNEEVFKDFDPVKSTKAVFAGCRRNVLAGPQVYLGSINVRDIKEQPYIFTKENIPFAAAASVYGHLPRFKNVPRDLVETNDTDSGKWGFNWRLESMEKDTVEVLKFQNKWTDEFQIFLNGVMQLPVGFPMPWEFGEYNIVMGHLEPMSPFFAYSKSTPAKSKLDQEILDEMYRLAVLKTQKSFMPPIANYSQNILSKNSFLPGKINNGMMKGDIEVVGGDPSMYGIRPSEMEMIAMIKRFIDEKSVNPVVAGDTPQGNPTATEVATVTQQAKQKLGLIIFGFINFETNLDLLRLYVVLENYTKADGTKLNKLNQQIEEKYRSVSIEKDIEGKGVGLKQIQFTDNLMPSNQLYMQEEGMAMDGSGKLMRDEMGKPIINPPQRPTKIIQVSPKALRQIKYTWYVEVVPSERETSLVNKIAFEDSILKAYQLFGPQSINQTYAKQKWSQINKINPNFFFTKQTDMEMGGMDPNSMQESPMIASARIQPPGIQQARAAG